MARKIRVLKLSLGFAALLFTTAAGYAEHHHNPKFSKDLDSAVSVQASQSSTPQNLAVIIQYRQDPGTTDVSNITAHGGSHRGFMQRRPMCRQHRSMIFPTIRT